MCYPESYTGDWVIISENRAIAFSGSYQEVCEFMVKLSFQSRKNQRFNLWSVSINQCNFVDFLDVKVLKV